MKLLYIPPITEVKEELYTEFSKLCYVDHMWIDGTKSRPDLAYVQSGAASVDLLKDVANVCPVYQWDGDYRPEGLPGVKNSLPYCDKTFNAAAINDYIWLPHGVADWHFKPVKHKAQGVVMIANHYGHFPGGVERHELGEILKKRGDFTGWGSGFGRSLPYKQCASVNNNARFAIGGNIYNDVPKYFSNRPMNAMAAGTCYIMRYVPGLEEVFTDGVDCLFWRTFSEALSHLTISDKVRNKIAKTGQAKVWQNYRFKQFAEKIIKEWEKR